MQKVQKIILTKETDFSSGYYFSEDPAVFRVWLDYKIVADSV